MPLQSPTDAQLADLPNELLIHVLSSLSTRDLLPLAAVCHRFHNLVIRIVHHRLLVAASLDEQRLMLECYQPSAQYTAPRVYCDYLATDGLSAYVEGEGSLYGETESTGRLGKISSLYSRFLPVKPEGPKGRRLFPSTTFPELADSVPIEVDSSTFEPMSAAREPLVETVSLESHELFTQLCTAAHLVRDGPRGGIYRSFTTVAEGTVRIWRKWLGEQALRSHPRKEDETECSKASRVLWVDSDETFGIRVRVSERTWRGEQQPVLVRSDEDLAVSYLVDLEGGISTWA